MNCLCCCCCCLRTETHDADRAAEILKGNQRGRADGLPKELQGVFWMSDNSAPELTVSLEANKYDAKRRSVALRVGAPLNWSFNEDCGGRCEMCVIGFGHCVFTKMHFVFDEKFTRADMPLSCCGCVPINCLVRGRWTMEKLDQDNWKRMYTPCSGCCTSKEPREMYIAKKVINGDGDYLPAYAQMMAKARGQKEGPGEVKTLRQVIIVPWCGLPADKPKKFSNAPVQVTM